MPLSFGCQRIQQITVPQNNILAIMNVITQHHIDTSDLAGMAAALEPHTRRLKSLGAYEQRRRRAAKETLAEFNNPRNLASSVRQRKSSSSCPGNRTKNCSK